jgi:sterol O-acyltransferase
MAYALNGLAKRNGDGGDWTPESPASSITSEMEEDYDTLRLDPATIITGSHGGGLEGPIHSDEGSTSVDSSVNGDKIYEAIHPRPSGAVSSHSLPQLKKDRNGRPKSIQVMLEKTNKKGRYTLTADDPDIREILRHRIEQDASDGKDKRRSRFTDLVFTRQFTTFDRQNPLSSQSPFHGFFTLFWLAMGLLLFRVAMQNLKTQGSIFGASEILHMMYDRDLLVMGMTDGAMTLATMFCWLLQKIISKGYLRWDGSGWILQSLSEVAFITGIIGWTFYRDWP